LASVIGGSLAFAANLAVAVLMNLGITSLTKHTSGWKGHGRPLRVAGDAADRLQNGSDFAMLDAL
jgi:hypothetical protein